jgi:hypothetical protein
MIMAEYEKNTSVPSTGTKFKDMSAGQKLVFIGKSFIFIITSGFAFPTIWSD